MDGIRSLSQLTFNGEQKFLDPSPTTVLDTVELTDTDSAPLNFKRRTQENVLAWLSKSEGKVGQGGLPYPSLLRLVRIQRDMDVRLHLSESVFTKILDLMKADVAIQYMICRDYDGFHEFNSPGFHLTRFIGTPFYALLWTFDPASMDTVALFLDRRHSTFEGFTATLEAFKGLIHTPSMLCFVSGYFMLRSFDLQTGGWELATLRTVERETGFGPHPTAWRGLEPVKMVRRWDLNQLTSWLQAVNEVATNAKNRTRHQREALAILKHIHNEGECHGTQHGVKGNELLRKYHESTNAMNEAIPSVERHMVAYIEYLDYIKDRSEKLASVLFSLLTHEDAHASIDLAAAARRDSSSMKTIAIMTMVFLPATFFAALFALPSLKWDQGEGVVAQGNFWIYWAFTIPTTALVLVVWLVINYRGWISDTYLKMLERWIDYTWSM